MKIAIFTLASNKPKISKIGYNIDVFSWSLPKIENVNIRDYDGVIFDVDSLSKNELKIDLSKFEDEVLCADATNDILREKDSFIVIIGNPNHIIEWYPIVSRLGFSLNQVNGSGSSLKYEKNPSINRYIDYVSKINKYNYSFKKDSSEITDDMKSIASVDDTIRHSHTKFNSFLENRAGHIVAGSLNFLTYKYDYNDKPIDVEKFLLGKFILLPTLNNDSRDSIDCVLDIISGDSSDELTMPDWVDNIVIVGQDKIDDAINNNELNIDKLSKDNEILRIERNEFRRPVEILYKSDKQLEKSIKWYFEKIGINITEPEKDNGVEFYFEHNSKKFVVEVKSTKKDSIDKKGLRQVAEWQNDILLETGEDYKPVLIVSVQYDILPENRNKDFLPDNLIVFAEKRNIAVLPVNYIFIELQKIENNELLLNEFIESVYNLNGMAKI